MDIIALDSQIFKSYEACSRMCKFSFVDRLEPLVKEKFFDRGDLVHHMLAIHYKIIRHNYNCGSDPRLHRIHYEKIVDIVCEIGQRYSLKLDLEAEECIRAIDVYREYAEYYRMENWVPHHIEQPFSYKLYEDDDLTILWEGRVDLIVEQGIVDTKSSERRGEPNDLDDQFMGYCYCMGVHNLIINKVGFQKTLKPQDKFERYTKSYPKALLEEWRNHVIELVKTRMLDEIKEAHELVGKLAGRMYRNFNYTACNKWGCRFYNVCKTEEEVRAWKISTMFKIGKPWQPAKSLEVK